MTMTKEQFWVIIHIVFENMFSIFQQMLDPLIIAYNYKGPVFMSFAFSELIKIDD